MKCVKHKVWSPCKYPCEIYANTYVAHAVMSPQGNTSVKSVINYTVQEEYTKQSVWRCNSRLWLNVMMSFIFLNQSAHQENNPHINLWWKESLFAALCKIVQMSLTSTSYSRKVVLPHYCMNNNDPMIYHRITTTGDNFLHNVLLFLLIMVQTSEQFKAVYTM